MTLSRALPPLRFGLWAPVSGSHASWVHPDEPYDASWERTRRLVVQAEDLGFDAVLLAQFIANTWDDRRDQLDAWSAAAALAAVTSRIEIIAAIKPYFVNPVVLAKMALGIEEISRGRMALNIVNGWNRDEAERTGLAFLDHDERYAYGTEWLTIVSSLLVGERTSFDGRYLHVDGVRLRPSSALRSRPALYLGGESGRARVLAAELADTWVLNGRPVEVISGLVQDLRDRPRRGAPLRFGMSAFVIARSTDSDAQEAFDEAWELAEREHPGSASRPIGGANGSAVMFTALAEHPHIGTNGGTAAGLIGSYGTVASRIIQFYEAGIDTFLLQAQPLGAELARFAGEVVPRVRARLGEPTPDLSS